MLFFVERRMSCVLVFNVPVLQGVCVCPTAWKWDVESTLFHTKLTWTTQSDLGVWGCRWRTPIM